MTCLLFLAGLILYMGYGLPGLAYLLTVTLGSYLLGRLIPGRRWLLGLSVGLQALALLTVKLQPLTGMELTAPLGLSYFTLRVISYQVDVFRGKYPPEGDFFRYGLYVTFFPCVFLGPIEGYDRFRENLERRRITWDGISRGAARFAWGLFQKLAIATRAGVIVKTVSAAPETYQGAYAALALLLYSVQLYTDFSGGIDMVLGVCRMLGLELSENFRVPYASQSVAEFWRRWHITLGAWLREYIYIPLGGSRKGKARKVLNTVVTFLVSGMWHGGQYLLWGVLNGVFVSLGDRLKTRCQALNRLLTFLIITALWAFFVWPDTVTAVHMLCSVFTVRNWGSLAADALALGLNVGEWTVLALSTAALVSFDARQEKARAAFLRRGPAGRVAVVCGIGLIILIFGMYGIGFDAEAFIYSRF